MQMECYQWRLQRPKKKVFTLEEFDISVQEYNINRYDYKKNGILSEVTSHYFRKNAPP